MHHHMGLYTELFSSMKSGRKTVEVRLNDEKRRKLQVGDLITFTKVPEGNEKLRAEVIELREFFTFKEMYEAIPANEFDALSDTVDDMVKNTYQIYTPEQEAKWGILAITVKVVG
jgi:ASC-1-like (ASCH) protein